MSKKKVLIIENSSGLTGAYKSISIMVDHLSKEFEFTWVFPKNSVLGKDFKENVKYLDFIEIQKNWKLLIYFPVLLWNSFKLITFVRKEAVAIVHVNDLYNMTGVIIKIFQPEIKLIYHVRLLPNSYVARFYRIWIKIIELFADHIICVSDAVKQHVKSPKSTTIFGAVELRENYPEKIVGQLPPIRILYIGNFIQGKGQDLALQAFEFAQPRVHELSLCFVGGLLNKAKNNQYLDALKRTVATLNQSSRISFREFTLDIEKLIKEADIVLNLSESESFSMVCLEALFYGTPLIASDCGGPRELFENGKSGLLVPNKNIEKAGEAIVQLASNFNLRQRFSKEGKDFARKKFNPIKQAMALKAIYKSI